MPEININETTPRFEDAFMICWAVPEPRNRRWAQYCIRGRYTWRDGDRSERADQKVWRFAATDHVNFAVKRGEIFGLPGQTAQGNRPPLR